MKNLTTAAARSDKNKHATAGAAAAIATTSSTLPLDTAPATLGDDGTLQMRSVTTYLDQFGIRDLLPLHVVYHNHSAPVELHGDLSTLNNEGPTKGMLQKVPSIEWPASSQEASSYYTLAFIDLGPDTGTTKVASAFFPLLHSLWTGCKSSSSNTAGGLITLKDCATTIKAYTPPGNTAKIPNRYFFLLLEHGVGYSELQLQGGPANRFLSAKMRKTMPIFGISLARLLKENKGMRAVRWNLMLVHGTK